MANNGLYPAQYAPWKLSANPNGNPWNQCKPHIHIKSQGMPYVHQWNHLCNWTRKRILTFGSIMPRLELYDTSMGFLVRPFALSLPWARCPSERLRFGSWFSIWQILSSLAREIAGRFNPTARPGLMSMSGSPFGTSFAATTPTLGSGLVPWRLQRF